MQGVREHTEGSGEVTGIERLEGMSMAFASYAWGASLSEALGDIAAQIAREHAEDCFRMGERAADVSMSAYDLLPADEHAAIAWVREHGGLDAVKRHWKGYVPAAWLEEAKSRHKQRRDRLKAYAWELECKCAERRETIEELGKTIDEMRPRLMPEGMEWLVEAWPRFEDDAPVRFLDDFERYGDENGVSAVTMYSDGSFALNFRAYSKGEHVNRPAPKVLDADGAEIRVGDTVYGTVDMEYRITSLSEYEPGVVHAEAIEGGNECGDEFIAGNPRINSFQLEASKLTHRAPVLAADGRPLRVGETVWSDDGRERHVVLSTEKDAIGNIVTEVQAPGMVKVHISPSRLTHERPVSDTWERLEEDARKSPCGYFCQSHGCGSCPHCQNS